MAQAFQVQIISPTASVLNAQAQLVEIPGSEGDFGVLANHAPCFSMLRPGVITVHSDGQAKRFFVTSGYADVAGDSTTILSDSVQALDGLDVAEANAALQQAQADLASASDDVSKARAEKRVAAAKALVVALGELL